MTRPCPVCSVPAYRAELRICPLCGAECDKAELDRLARGWYEQWFDEQENLRVFGTVPKRVIQ